MLQGNNEVECRILHTELKQVFEEEENNLQGHNHSSMDGKDIASVQQKQQKIRQNRWHPTRRRFPDKGHQGEKAITPEKVSTTNQFQALTDKRDDIMQNNDQIITSDTTHNVITNIRDGKKEMTKKDWSEGFNEDSVNKNLGIKDFSLVVEDPVWCGESEPPNSVLHNLFIYNINRVEDIGGLLERRKDMGHNHEDQILKDANISPRVIKSIKQERKEKKQSITEKTFPSRSHPKRGGRKNSNKQ
ncbi:hypothetical protein FXO37_12992 [Capsicum annuum]|nr:hypothetical protein FXO37_12992 [Capsicum annuum]